MKTDTTPVVRHFEACEQCGAPLDHQQRYCVNCATRRSDPTNPATRYFAAMARRSRIAAQPRVKQAGGNGARAAAVAFLVLLPAAVGAGVLVGRSGGNDDGSAIAAALRESGGLASADASGGGDSALASNKTSSVTSDFKLDKGYAVELTTVKGSSSADDVAKAKDDAEGKGAEDVGVIVPADFTITPDPGGDYVIYSGEFEKQPDADAALKKLKGDFPDATVITVKAAANGGSNTDPKDGAGGRKLAETDYGDVHQVESIKPTEADQQEGSDIAEEQANSGGKEYIETQQNLPDVIAVGAP